MHRGAVQQPYEKRLSEIAPEKRSPVQFSTGNVTYIHTHTHTYTHTDTNTDIRTRTEEHTIVFHAPAGRGLRPASSWTDAAPSGSTSPPRATLIGDEDFMVVIVALGRRSSIETLPAESGRAPVGLVDTGLPGPSLVDVVHPGPSEESWWTRTGGGRISGRVRVRSRSSRCAWERRALRSYNDELIERACYKRVRTV